MLLLDPHYHFRPRQTTYNLELTKLATFLLIERVTSCVQVAFVSLLLDDDDEDDDGD